MPVVPTQDTPSVAPQEAPTVQQRAPYRLMQMAEIGPEQQIRMGQAMQGAGNDLGNIVVAQQQQVNEAAVKDSDAKLTTGITGVLYGDPNDPTTGYLNQKGQNAVSGAPDAVKALQDMQQNLHDGMQNDPQRQMFKQTADARIAAAIRTIQEHAGQQAGVYAMESSKLRSQAASDQAIQAFNPMPGANNDLFTQSVATQHVELEHQADQLGLKDNTDGTPGARTDYVKNGMVQTYSGLVNHLLENNQSKAAADTLNSIRDQLPPAVADKLQNFVSSAGTKDDALSLALDTKAAHPGDIAAQEGALDKQFKSGSITSDVHDMALQKLRQDSAQQRSEQVENDKAVLGRVWDMKQKNPNLAITDLSSSDYAYIAQRGLGPHVDSILTSGPAIDDAQLYNDLAHQAVDPEGREKFAQTNLMLYRGQLTPAHFDQIQRMQLSIDKGDAKQMDADAVTHNAVQHAKADLVAAGFNLNPKPGSEDAANLARFESSLRDSLVAAGQAKGRPLTPQEARDITLNHTKNQTLGIDGIFAWVYGHSMGLIPGLAQESKPPWQMTDEEKARDWAIPNNDRQQIVQALTKAGQPTDEVTIQRVYKRAQGVR
jgi:hypothetical protein